MSYTYIKKDNILILNFKDQLNEEIFTEVNDKFSNMKDFENNDYIIINFLDAKLDNYSFEDIYNRAINDKIDENNKEKRTVKLLFVVTDEIAISIIKEYIYLLSNKLNSKYEFSIFNSMQDAITYIDNKG